MGFRTVTIARGREKEKLATELGAHSYIDSQGEDAALQRLGGAKVILATAANSRSMGPQVPGLAARGRLIVVGASPEPIEANPAKLILGARSIEGSLTGTAIDNQDVQSFSVLENIRPMIETRPLENAAEAYGRMIRNEARFRMVLTPDHPDLVGLYRRRPFQPVQLSVPAIGPSLAPAPLGSEPAIDLDDPNIGRCICSKSDVFYRLAERFPTRWKNSSPTLLSMSSVAR